MRPATARHCVSPNRSADTGATGSKMPIDLVSVAISLASTAGCCTFHVTVRSWDSNAAKRLAPVQ